MELKSRRKSQHHALPQDLINSMTLEFKSREWDWLINLPRSYTRTLTTEDEPFDPSLFTHYGEFFLTLCGIKPCLLITSRGHPTFGEDLYINVLQPLMDKLAGFELFRVDNFARTSSNHIVYIFTSRYHQKFPLVQELLIKPQRGPIPMELLSKALGYPTPCGQSTVCYVDLTTTQELGVDCVTVFEFTAREGFDYTIKMHFDQCAAEFRKLGKELTILSQ